MRFYFKILSKFVLKKKVFRVRNPKMVLQYSKKIASNILLKEGQELWLEFLEFWVQKSAMSQGKI